MKTITLEQAFAKATKGPFVLDDGMIDIEQQAECLIEGKGTSREWQAIGINDRDGFAEVAVLAHPCNAALLAHCFNHFQEVIAAIENLSPLFDNDSNLLKAYEKEIEQLETIVAKAKQVTLP